MSPFSLSTMTDRPGTAHPAQELGFQGQAQPVRLQLVKPVTCNGQHLDGSITADLAARFALLAGPRQIT